MSALTRVHPSRRSVADRLTAVLVSDAIVVGSGQVREVWQPKMVLAVVGHDLLALEVA
jgi:hypothetical protein